MKVLFLASAETILLDSNSNKVSLVNIHDDFLTPQFPFLITRFGVLAILRKEADDEDSGNCQIKISLGAQSLLDSPFSFEFEGGNIHRSIISMNGLVLTEPGDLKVELFYSDEIIGTWTTTVTQLKSEIIEEI